MPAYEIEVALRVAGDRGDVVDAQHRVMSCGAPARGTPRCARTQCRLHQERRQPHVGKHSGQTIGGLVHAKCRSGVGAESAAITTMLASNPRPTRFHASTSPRPPRPRHQQQGHHRRRDPAQDVEVAPGVGHLHRHHAFHEQPVQRPFHRHAEEAGSRPVAASGTEDANRAPTGERQHHRGDREHRADQHQRRGAAAASDPAPRALQARRDRRPAERHEQRA